MREGIKCLYESGLQLEENTTKLNRTESIYFTLNVSMWLLHSIWYNIYTIDWEIFVLKIFCVKKFSSVIFCKPEIVRRICNGWEFCTYTLACCVRGYICIYIYMMFGLLLLRNLLTRIGERSRKIRCGRQKGLGSYWALTSEVVACLPAVLENRRRHRK